VSLSFPISDTPGTNTFSSVNFNSSSSLVLILRTNNLSKASDVSDRIIQFLRKVHPPINTSSLGGIKTFQF
tara:strand:+ start:720 stop:932 length:213 start_codon:yes stop_codon:yes gene_type:complete